jgi:integral membrane sensor domain MASE1
MIGLFSVFEVMEPQRNYMEELYDWVITNSHGCFIVTFLALHIYFIYIKHAYFATLMKNSLELLELFFCENVCRLTR